jgi:hypothetical protein
VIETNRHPITFADGFPLCTAYPAPDYEPMVTFTYVDPGYQNIDPYIAHLRRHRPLFRQLARLQFFYVATKWGRHQEAGVLFSMLIQGEELADLIRMFDVQNRWDNKQYSRVTDAELSIRNQAQERFQGQAFETLRRLWRRNQLPEDFQPRQEPFMAKQKIPFHTMVAPGQEGVFGESAKRWGDGWQVRKTAISNEDGPSPAGEARSLNEG